MSKASASEALSGEVAGLVSADDIRFALGVQAETRERLQGAAAALGGFNEQSARELQEMAGELERYAKLQRAMKRDLDDVFRRLRTLRVALERRFPQECAAAAAAASTTAAAADDDDEEEEE